MSDFVRFRVVRKHRMTEPTGWLAFFVFAIWVSLPLILVALIML